MKKNKKLKLLYIFLLFICILILFFLVYKYLDKNIKKINIKKQHRFLISKNPEDIVYIPDNAFKSWLLSFFYGEHRSENNLIDSNYIKLKEETEIYKDEMKMIKRLFITNYGILDITGIEEAKNINYFNSNGNNIKVLPLSNLFKLETLILGYVEKLDITPLENLINLKILYLDDNKISDISPLKNLINLEELNLSSNLISDITVLKDLKNLRYLDLGNNNISDITSLENLKNLKTLILDRNKISDISSLENLVNLEELNLYENYTYNIKYLEKMINLKKLNLLQNGISDITPLKNLINLEKLTLSFNNISDITPLKKLVNLKDLALNHNAISDITALKIMNKLKFLRLQYNKILDITPLNALINLEYLLLHNNLISDINSLKNLNKLNILDLNFNKILDFSILKAKNIKQLVVGQQQVTIFAKEKNIVLNAKTEDGKEITFLKSMENEFLKVNDDGSATIIKKPQNKVIRLKVGPYWKNEYGYIEINTDNLEFFNPDVKKLIVRKGFDIDLKKGIKNLPKDAVVIIDQTVDTKTIGNKTGKLKIQIDLEKYEVDVPVDVIDNLEMTFSIKDNKTYEYIKENPEIYLNQDKINLLKKDETFKFNFIKLGKYELRFPSNYDFGNPIGYQKNKNYSFEYKGDPNTDEYVEIKSGDKIINIIHLYKAGVKNEESIYKDVLFEKTLELPITGRRLIFIEYIVSLNLIFFVMVIMYKKIYIKYRIGKLNFMN